MKRARKQTLNEKKKRFEMSMKEAHKSSRYAKKRRFLDRNGGMAKDYPDKPWK